MPCSIELKAKACVGFEDMRSAAAQIRFPKSVVLNLGMVLNETY